MSSIPEEVLARAGTFFLVNIRSVTQAAQTAKSFTAVPQISTRFRGRANSSTMTQQCEHRQLVVSVAVSGKGNAHVPLPGTIFHADLPFHVPLPATIFHTVSTISCPSASNNLPLSIYHFMSLCQQQSSTQYLPFHVPLPATIFHTVSTISCPSASNYLPPSIYHFMSLCQQQSSTQYLPFHVPLPATIFHAVSTISIPSAMNDLPCNIYHSDTEWTGFKNSSSNTASEFVPAPSPNFLCMNMFGSLQCSSSIASFKSALKTHLFSPGL